MIQFLKMIGISMLCLFSIQLSAQSGNINRANKEYELYDYKKALKSYLKVLESDANNVEALSKLADCYYHLNQLTDARQWFEKALEQQGFEFQYMLQYAHTLMGLGDYDMARQWYQLYGEGFPDIGQHYAKACEIAKERSRTKPVFEVSSTQINSSKSEYAPTLFGDVLVFASTNKRRTGETAEEAQKNSLFLSAKDKEDRLLDPAFLFRSKISNQYGVGPISFSANGKKVAFTKNNFRDGIRQIPSSGIELSLYTADVRDDGQWKNIVPFPYNGSGFSTGFPSLSPDGNTLYFASDRLDGFGGFDIYVSTKDGSGKWSFPINAGAPINSPGDEITPFFTGQTLYFSSNWHHGFGGFDVFRALKTNGTWSKLYHQGVGVNSSRDDYGFVYDQDEKVGYLTSNRTGGKGGEDIYRIAESTERFIVQVFDTESKEAIAEANLDFTDCGQGVVQSNEKGEFAFQIAGGIDCELSVSKAGFAPQKIKIQSNGSKNIQGIEVALESVVNKAAFVGRIIQAGTSNAIEKVFVTAVHTTNRKQSKTQSDKLGYYTLSLELGQDYTIKFSKAGFGEKERSIHTGTGEDKSILDITSMISSSTSIPVPSDKPSTAKKAEDLATTDIKSGVENPSTKPEVDLPPVIKSKPEVIIPSPKPASTKTTSGYSVQLAAISYDKTVNLGRYAKTKKFGELYIKSGSKYQQVRLGVFKTKSAAQAAQKELAKLGHDKAYVVLEKGGTAPIIAAPKVPKTTSSTTTIKTEAIYYVRLGAYGSPASFNDLGLKIYGTFEQETKGNLTIFYLNAGPKIGRARVIRDKAREKGFEGAYVVVKKNGLYVKA